MLFINLHGNQAIHLQPGKAGLGCIRSALNACKHHLVSIKFVLHRIWLRNCTIQPRTHRHWHAKWNSSRKASIYPLKWRSTYQATNVVHMLRHSLHYRAQGQIVLSIVRAPSWMDFSFHYGDSSRCTACVPLEGRPSHVLSCL